MLYLFTWYSFCVLCSPPIVGKASIKADEARHKIKDKAKEMGLNATTVKEKAKDVAIEAEIITDKVTSQDL